MRKPSPSSRPRLDDLPTPELIAHGAALLANHDYKDAIDVYKLLLKRQPQAGWRESLVSAYLERARELAGKGMYREAAILWENIPGLCGQIRQPEWYIDWLLQTGQYAKALRAYAQHAAALSGASELETRIGALMLAGQKEVLQTLPQDAPLRRQLSLAQAALRAYSQGEAEAVVRECLQNISIRSSYRDLRQALAALLKLETDPAGAPALVERIPATSPYHDLAEIVRAAAAREPTQAMLTLDPVQRDLAVHLLGLNPQQIKLLKEWARLGEQPNDKALFGFITNNLAILDQEQARQAGLALLAGYPKGQSIYIKLFGPLPTLEAHRLQALQAEREDDIHRARRHWQACVDELAKDRNHADHPLMAALVLRHIAELTQREDHAWGDHSDISSYLEKSLDFDPEDRDVYLQLAEHYKEADDDKAYHRWVERAIQQFPDDPQVLMAAVATATARKAYKKAAGFAERVLELDPINSKARTVLINAHLAHARKQMSAGKYALAEKELGSASQLERDNARSGIVEINRGLLAFRQCQQESMQHWLKEGLRLAGSPLLGWFRLAVEAARLKLEPTTFQHPLGLADLRKLTASRTDLLTLTQWINAYQEEGVEQISSVLEDLEKPLKRAIKELSKEEDLLSVCECFHQAPHYELLEYAATGALQRYPERPIFIYYQVYGRAEGEADDLNERDYDRLEGALDAAKEADDKRAVMRIARLIHLGRRPPFFPHGGPRSMPMPFPRSRGGPRSTLPPMPRELEQMREDLAQMPPALRKRMLDQILDSLPPDDEFPPEVQRAIMKALLLGGERLEELLNMDIDDFPPPGRGRSRGRRS